MLAASVAKGPSMQAMSEAIPFLPKPKNIDDSMAGYSGFDPMGFSDYYDVKYLREAEIKHGRICMLAVVGMVSPLLSCFQAPVVVTPSPKLPHVNLADFPGRAMGGSLPAGAIPWRCSRRRPAAWRTEQRGIAGLTCSKFLPGCAWCRSWARGHSCDQLGAGGSGVPGGRHRRLSSLRLLGVKREAIRLPLRFFLGDGSGGGSWEGRGQAGAVPGCKLPGEARQQLVYPLDPLLQFHPEIAKFPQFESFSTNPLQAFYECPAAGWVQVLTSPTSPHRFRPPLGCCTAVLLCN